MDPVGFDGWCVVGSLTLVCLGVVDVVGGRGDVFQFTSYKDLLQLLASFDSDLFDPLPVEEYLLGVIRNPTVAKVSSSCMCCCCLLLFLC